MLGMEFIVTHGFPEKILGGLDNNEAYIRASSLHALQVSISL
jgi:hypothetical protein